MKKIFLLTLNLTAVFFLHAQITICSWNLENFGKSKSDSTIQFIANTIKDFDVIAIQEVVTGNSGIRAITRLQDELNKKGIKWDYTVSDATISSSHNISERYAFIWKTSKLTLINKAWLEKKYDLEIEREPYCATFKSKDKNFTLVNFHAIPKQKQPETEIKYFKFLPLEYADMNLIFCGDFNCAQSHTVFNPLKKMGYKPVFVNQKTSLKENYNRNECLASEYDNMFYKTSKINFEKSGVIHFYKSFATLKEARCVSDHLPVYFQFSLN